MNELSETCWQSDLPWQFCQCGTPTIGSKSSSALKPLFLIELEFTARIQGMA